MSKPIKIEIIGDTKGLRGAFGEAESGADRLQRNLLKIGAVIGAAFAVDRIVTFGGAMLRLATDMELGQRKIDTVFGDQADAIMGWADTVNEAFGTSAGEVSLLAANMADLLKPMGMTTESAAAMSQELVGLSPALAQWSAGTYNASEVSEILSKAILGEREQLKMLGISINQAEVDTRGLAIAQAEGRTEVTMLDKALATQQLILEKSTDAQAGFTASTSTLAGQQALLQARFTELKEYLATKLTPVLLQFGQWIAETGVPTLQRWMAGLRDLRQRFNDIRVALQPFLDQLRPLIDRIREMAARVAQSEQVMLGLRVILIGIGVALAALVLALAAAAAAIAVAAVAIVYQIGRITDKIMDLVSAIRRHGSDIYDAVTDPFRRAIKWVQDQWDRLKSTLTGGINIPNPFGGIIGRRAMGGDVTRSGIYDVGERGRERVVLPQGARVMPAHSTGGGGDTINVYGANLSAGDVAREIAWRRRIGSGR